MLKVVGTKCEGMLNPIGIDSKRPRFSWYLESDKRNTMQTAFRLIVSCSEEAVKAHEGEFFDSNRQESGDSSCLIGRMINQSATRYYWAVKVWSNNGEEEWGEVQWFESGLLNKEDWVANWIEPLQRPAFRDGFFTRAVMEKKQSPEELSDMLIMYLDENAKPVDERAFNPCPVVRKEFALIKKVRRACAYVTAHGIYRVEINGKRVGDLEFMPEATPYDKYLQYQTYDVAGLLSQGENAVGAVLADGWWAGRIGNNGDSCGYGNRLALLLQINVEYEDGTKEVIASDGSFTGFVGPWRYADLYVGEKYDARLELDGWSQAGYNEALWQNVQECDYGKDMLVGQNAEPIRIIKRMKPVSIMTSPKGETLVDFGQVIAGNASFGLTGKLGQEIEFAYSEQLELDGNFWHSCMGLNNQHRDYYTCKGEGEETYEPCFTYRGFRYIKVTGYDKPLDINKIEARLIASDVEYIGGFRCSDEKVTRLQSNIQWTLISNLMSIPTDNPDRERAGWTGDAQMIAPTFNYNFDLRAFWKRWMAEHALEQYPTGEIPMVIPFWKGYDGIVGDLVTFTGWGDDCIIVPWEAYQSYGDVSILESSYEMMSKWMDFVVSRAAARNPDDIGELTPEREANLRYIWNGDFQFGDWLTPSASIDEDGTYHYGRTPLDKFTPCFYSTYSAELMAKIAHILGKIEDEAYYSDLAAKIRKATIAEYFDTGYIMDSRFQGATVLALKMGFVPESNKIQAGKRLVELIAKNNGLLDTGFSSTQHLFDVLVDIGRPDLAYDILFSEKSPSWMYEINNGATAIWESWQAIGDGEVRPVSFIQYANGCVGKWMYHAIAGIDCEEAGYKRIRIAPVMDPKGRITSAEGSLMTPNGKVTSNWRISEGTMQLKVSIPVNTTANIVFPGKTTATGITEGRNVVSDAKVCDKTNAVILSVGSGDYTFKYDIN